MTISATQNAQVLRITIQLTTLAYYVIQRVLSVMMIMVTFVYLVTQLLIIHFWTEQHVKVSVHSDHMVTIMKLSVFLANLLARVAEQVLSIVVHVILRIKMLPTTWVEPVRISVTQDMQFRLEMQIWFVNNATLIVTPVQEILNFVPLARIVERLY